MEADQVPDRWWEPPARRLIEGRPVMLVGAVATAWVAMAPLVRELGATRVLVLATEGRGVGPQPDADGVEVLATELPRSLTLMERIRAASATLRDLPPDLHDAVERFDPERTALVLGTFLNEVPEVAGRPLLAHRRPEWVALEDKTVVDALWDRAGVARRPSAVVPIGQATTAARTLDARHGTVWAADAREGFHGGASLTRWVGDHASAERALADLGPHCDTVRVMPFLEGIPCSIHGIVMDGGVVAARPVEMVTLRRGHDLVYAGCASYWDPEPAVREQMRSIARTVGEAMRREVGFRGAFTIDGVVGADGFWPTELNPRFGAGLGTLARGLDGLPLTLVNDLIVAGVDPGITASALEEQIVSTADRQRAGGTWHIGAEPGRALAGEGVCADEGGALRWAGLDEEPDATVVAGPGYVRATLEPARTPAGPSVAPWAVRFWAFADRELGLGLGPLTAAVDPVRAAR